MTKQEERVLMALGYAWNSFLKLPLQHRDDQAEFRALIHRAQDMVAARATYRDTPLARRLKQ